MPNDLHEGRGVVSRIERVAGACAVQGDDQVPALDRLFRQCRFRQDAAHHAAGDSEQRRLLHEPASGQSSVLQRRLQIVPIAHIMPPLLD
jgi:hypothetical protein